MKNYIVQITFILFSILLFVNGLTSVPSRTIREDLLNQKDYMIAISIIIFIFSIISIYVDWKKRDSIKDEAKPTGKINKKVLVIIAASLLFVLGATYIGFFTSTLLFVFSITFYLNEKTKKNIVKSASFSVGLTIILYIVFNFINVYFPETLLI